MKLSISLTEADVALLDEQVRTSALPSRSAAVQRAIRMAGRERLDHDYAAAWQEWTDSGDGRAWEAASADGLR